MKMGAYQAELHFQCDVLDASYDWVPLAVLEEIGSEHDWVLKSFTRRPLYSCGVPTPLPGGAPRTSACPPIDGGLGASCTDAFECPPKTNYTAVCRQGCCDYDAIR